MEPRSGAIVAEMVAGIVPMDCDAEFSGLASDSREVAPGFLFAALPGTQGDGRAFIADAVRRGAVAVLAAPEARAEVEALGVRFIADPDPRHRLALIAATFYGPQPRCIAAVTGTNGKTSVTVFLRQIWEALGYGAASVGTVGVTARSRTTPLTHTTPGPIALHRLLASLKSEGVEHVAMEASSHGLDQRRLDGVRLAAAGFTNITRDHLDYHVDFRHYIAAKLRLFEDLLPDEAVAIVNADAAEAGLFTAAAQARGARLVTVGVHGETLKLVDRQTTAHGQHLVIDHDGRRIAVELPLAGAFQASNALVAAGFAIGLGEDPQRVVAALAQLNGAPGRMELVAFAASGAPVYVDYAHTPDALETVLKALRPHVTGRLFTVFGCGGDRDAGKRPLMGGIAARLADVAIVTDDNPRSEDPARIRREVLFGCPQAREIGDRAVAIRTAIADLRDGDVLVIAGKGHESGQIVGSEIRPFLDADEAVKAARELGGAAASHAGAIA
ncbi:MAG TPA: UDP-N-acetylmuramoyl-L-alanyl-D-glutamate--2,6-diaminopimelate ligase [Rhizomicrobium sp.]|jgi:UDP-N-acetylmuramoyl-L-alanyl-D-glutamate--2,6-diaminopimelate ligase